MPGFSVTIAIPTFNRPELLRRALRSVENQTYTADEIIVSDNASQGDEVEKVVNEFLFRMPNLRYIKQEKNIGAGPNFFECLNYSKSDLFMWVADDDEISPDCLQEMVDMFNKISGLAIAIPRWHFYSDLYNFEIMPRRSYKSDYWPLRISKFMYRSTDEMFYGLHRREWLNRCTLKPFFWPNRHETLNLIYPYLSEMVIAGKVVMTENDKAYWKNHDYGIKYHGQKERLMAGIVAKISYHFRYLMRRANLQVLYLSKIKSKAGLLSMIFFLPVSLITIALDFINHFHNITFGKIKQRN